MSIILNAISCIKCGDLIVSRTIHDYKACSCGAVAVDGGLEYMKRSWVPEETNPQQLYIEESVVFDYATKKYKKAGK